MKIFKNVKLIFIIVCEKSVEKEYSTKFFLSKTIEACQRNIETDRFDKSFIFYEQSVEVCVMK